MLVTIKLRDSAEEVEINTDKVIAIIPRNRAKDPMVDQPEWVSTIVCQDDRMFVVDGSRADVKAMLLGKVFTP